MLPVTTCNFGPQVIYASIEGQKEGQWTSCRGMIKTFLRDNVSRLTYCIFIICMVLFEPTAEASHREVQLFDHAYYAYLSYQPKEAVEEFKTSYLGVLYDAAIEAADFAEFSEMVEEFFSQVNKPNADEWNECNGSFDRDVELSVSEVDVAAVTPDINVFDVYYT